MRYFTLALFAIFHIVGMAQNSLNPVSWKVTYIDKSNSEGEITFIATIQDKWHIYSQRATDAGPIPTSFTITPAVNFQLVGKVEETNAHEEFVKAFDAKVFVFEHEAVFKQKIKRKNNQSFTIKMSLEFMTCNDMQCLPPKTVDLIFNVPAIAKK